MSNLLWPFKYRPKTIKEFLFRDERQKELILKFFQEKTIPNLLLSGHRGTGKTTLVYLLKDALEIDDVDFLKLNASDENSIDVMRNKVKEFIKLSALGAIKLVFLDEFEQCSNAAQQALKSMMEEYADNARFILATNHPHKVIVELHSRCQEIVFKNLDKDQMLLRSAMILKQEKVKVPSVELLDQYVDMAYPDFRKLLNLLQQNSMEGVLQEPVDTSRLMMNNLELVAYMEKDAWDEMREHICKTASDDDWEEIYKFLYSYLNEVGKFKDINKWKKGIIIIADHLYRHSTVADPEINFAACMIRLSEV